MDKGHVSGKSGEIPPFMVMDAMEKAKLMERAGENIVHLEIGEPDLDTPDVIKRAGVAAINEGRTKYTHSLGLIELREAICWRMKKEYGVTVGPDRVLVSTGSSAALFLALAAVIDPGDEVILSDPCYACYPNFITFLGGKPVHVPVREDDGFQFSAKSISEKITPRTRAILINSPSNPTGTLLDAAAMREIASLGPLVISDEIYHGMVYEGRADTILNHTDNAIVIDGFSKRHAMTGWRLGHAIVPERLLRPMQKMQQNFYISACSFSQWAGVAAIRHGDESLAMMRDTFNKRRRFLLERLGEIGLAPKCEPKGAFYAFVNVSRYSRDSAAFADEILEKAKVAVTPGIDFGPGGEGFIRLSYANSEERIGEGITRLKAFLDEYNHRATEARRKKY
ncbi:MAG: pyridoxal phosphate-dependent aminotransferase [Nitrospinae bacterium]|nr:pyridoxal phosphate-dependent aminotransferase [Nitrospinota bacterium]